MLILPNIVDEANILSEAEESILQD